MSSHLSKVAAQYDAEAGTYDGEYFANFALYHAVTLDNVRRYLPERRDKPILDAGGGTGIWSIELARLGYRVLLTDISEGMLKEATAKLANLSLGTQLQTQMGDICAMPEFADDQFAMVLCEGDPLSYCGDHTAAVRELVRVLEPGGALIASVDNRVGGLHWLRDTEDLSAVEDLLAHGMVVPPASSSGARFPVHAFTPQELAGLFEAAGLEVMRIIGKPVVAHRLACSRSADPDVQKRLFELELRYCDDPAFYPWGGHLEIVGRKRSPTQHRTP
jgi:ubiquinone/menaquinone biosynthesis C-methylase UbiE